MRMMQDAGVFTVPTQYTILSGARRDEGDALWAVLPEHSRRKMQKDRGALIGRSRAPGRQRRPDRVRHRRRTFPHQDNWREFPTMVSTGITPLRALRAATSAAAELLHLDDLGVIAEGKIADLIAMPGDPLADIDVTGRVDFVMKDRCDLQGSDSGCLAAQDIPDRAAPSDRPSAPGTASPAAMSPARVWWSGPR